MQYTMYYRQYSRDDKGSMVREGRETIEAGMSTKVARQLALERINDWNKSAIPVMLASGVQYAYALDCVVAGVPDEVPA